jgi:hypothetical protein
MTRTTDQDLTVEVGRRLDNIFGEPDSPREKTSSTDSRHAGGANFYPLRVVKANILSIDWEITDEAIAGLLKQLELLKATYRNDKVVQILIQMLISLGRYIKVRKGRANVRSMKVLKSVFAGLEKVAGESMTDPAARMEILRDKMKEFHALQAEVAAEGGRPRTRTPEKAVPESRFSLSTDELRQIAHILAAELKEIIRQEFSLLKKELSRAPR